MSDEGKLSRDEIDALLHGTAGSREDAHEPQLLTDYEKDALGEIGNISFGSAATVLSTLLQQRVEITTPTVKLIQADGFQEAFPRPYVTVSVNYTSGLQGSNALAIELDDAKTIADLMLGGDGSTVTGDLNDLHLSAVAEAMNQMMGGAATSLSAMLQRQINISPPSVSIVDLSTVVNNEFKPSGWIVSIAFRLRVGTLIDSSIMQFTPIEFAQELVKMFVEQMEPAPVASTSESADSESEKITKTMPAQATAAYKHAMEDHSPEMRRAPSVPPTTPVVRRPDYEDFSQDGTVPGIPKNLTLLYDVSLNVTVELGRTKKPIKEILELAPGAIVQLDKLAGEPVDILVNQKRIAIGEVVVIDENFGIRITDILAPVDRLRDIQPRSS